MKERMTFRERSMLGGFAVLLALFLMAGDSFQEKSPVVFLREQPYSPIWLVLLFCVYAAALFGALYFLYRGLSKRTAAAGGKESAAWDEKKLWRISFLLMLAGWLAYLVAYFPGSLPSDAMSQANQALGQSKMTNQHPVFSTLVMGVFLRFGKLVSNDYAGIFLYVLVETVLAAAVFSGVLVYVHKTAKSKTLTVCGLVFFAVCPTWGMMVETIIKDTMYTILFTAFMLLYAQLIQSRGSVLEKKGFLLKLLASMLLMCGWRHNGVYVASGTLVILLLIKAFKKYRKQIVVLLVLTVGIHYLLTKVIYPMAGVSSLSQRVLFSIPFQQTARYLKEYPEDVTDEEAEAIGAILDYENLAENYDANLSDPVKNTFKNGASKRQILAYFKAWFSMFLRHPEVYVAATLNNTYQYYYFLDARNFMREYQNYTKWKMNKDLELSEDPPALLQNLRDILVKWTELLQKIPVICWLDRCGFYTWILLAAFVFLWMKKRYLKMLLCVPLFVTVLICIASPVNGLQRYMWCVMATVILPLAEVMRREDEKEEPKDEKGDRGL